MNSKMRGETRPRPGQFRIKDSEANVIDEGKDKDKRTALIKSKEATSAYIKATNDYINEFIKFLKEIHRKDKSNKRTLNDDVKDFFKKYNGSLTELIEKSKPSRLFKFLCNCGPKMVHSIFNILKSPGSTLFYSNYVLMEGLQIFKIYLRFFGFISIDDDSKFKNKSKDNFRFMEYHGGIDKNQREKNKKIFNSKENRRGKLLKIILISPAGAEGINLSNVRQVHILEPYWNEVRIEQVIGRAIRQCQHRDLPLEERTVDVFRYKMVRSNGKETSDENLENLSRKKNNLLISFIEAIKEVAVDCELFKNHNMMGSKYKCFKFEESLLKIQ